MAVIREYAVIVAMIPVASIAGAAAQAERQIVLAERAAAAGTPAQIGVVATVRVVVIAEPVIQAGIEGVVARKVVVQAAADTRVVKGIAPVAATQRDGATCRIDPVLADAGCRVTVPEQTIAFLEIGFGSTCLDLRLCFQIGRQVV